MPRPLAMTLKEAGQRSDAGRTCCAFKRHRLLTEARRHVIHALRGSIQRGVDDQRLVSEPGHRGRSPRHCTVIAAYRYTLRQPVTAAG
jgi:hypothetical protein